MVKGGGVSSVLFVSNKEKHETKEQKKTKTNQHCSQAHPRLQGRL